MTEDDKRTRSVLVGMLLGTVLGIAIVVGVVLVSQILS